MHGARAPHPDTHSSPLMNTPTIPPPSSASPSTRRKLSVAGKPPQDVTEDTKKAQQALLSARSGRKSIVGKTPTTPPLAINIDKKSTPEPPPASPIIVNQQQQQRPTEYKRKQSIYYVDKTESRDVALKNLWTGNLNEAERLFNANKKSSSLAHVRWAETEFIRFWLSGDRSLSDPVIARFQQAEAACQVESKAVALQLQAAFAKHAERQPLMRRLSRRASNAMPILTSVGLLAEADNPGELVPSLLEFNAEKSALEEWKRLQGLAALCALLSGATQILAHGYVRGAMSLRRAWQIANRATSNPEAATDKPSALTLVVAVFQIALANVPPWVLKFLYAFQQSIPEPNPQAGKEALERLLPVSDPSGETHNYARLALAAYFLLQSQQEYRPDRAVMLKGADDIVSETLSIHPDWVLFAWMKSHILRRLGRLNESHDLVRVLAITVAREFTLRDERAYRLEFDLASLKFAQREWTAAEALLLPLVSDTSEFTAKGSAWTMLSACCAMRNNIVDAVRYLEALDDNITESSAGGRADQSWLWKLPVLLHRPNKKVLAYEIAYFNGMFKWFDSDVVSGRAGGGKEATSLVHKAKSELAFIQEADAISVVYPEFPIYRYEAAEELMVVSLLLGSLLSMAGDLDGAAAKFKYVMDNKDTQDVKDGTKDDPFVVPFTFYETGVVEIKRGAPIKAREALAAALKLCKKKNFSFHHALSFKVSGALRHVAQLQKPQGASAVDWKAHTDELGAYLGADAGKVHTRDMIALVIDKSSCKRVIEVVKMGDTVSWQFQVETHDVMFKVLFKPNKAPGKKKKKADGGGDAVSGNNDTTATSTTTAVNNIPEEVIEPSAKIEAGDFQEGFFTATKAGELIFEWDNTHNKYLPKIVHYNLSRD